MPPKINTELWEECKTAAQTEPQREILVIVTLTDWSRRTELKEKGRRVNHSFDSIFAVAGTLTCLEVMAIARHLEPGSFGGRGPASDPCVECRNRGLAHVVVLWRGIHGRSSRARVRHARH